MRLAVIYCVLAGLLATGCSVSKYVPAGESLYVGGNVKVIPDSSAKKDVGDLEDELENLLRPTPNSTIFGFPHKVWLYHVMGEPRKEKGFRNWFRKKFGEPPVYASQRVVSANSEILTGYMNNNGYFRSTATGELREGKNRTAEAYYEAFVKPRYFLNELTFVTKDTINTFNRDFLTTQKQGKGTLLRKGDPYRLEAIEAERRRVDRLLKEKGYYYFNPDYLIAKIDSTIGERKVNVFLEVKPTTSQLALKQYFIRDVYVYADYNSLSPDTMPSQARLSEGLRIVDPERLYRPRIFDDAIGFTRGSMYNSSIHDVSLSRLINLKNFKFVKNRFELVTRSDSAMLDVFYYLTPVQKKSLRAEFSGVTKSNNLAGSQVDLSWSNRNLFRAAEFLRISAIGGIDFQVGGGNAGGGDSLAANDFVRFNVQGELSFPRFIIPFYKPNPAESQSLPQTILTTGYETLNQQGLFTQTSIRGQWGYVWRRNAEVEHSLTPFALNVIRPRNISELFIERIFDSNNPNDLIRYLRILENRLIFEGLYTITYRPTPGLFSKNQFFLSGGIDIAGNIAGLFDKTLGGDDGQLFGIPFEQFARFDGEARYYRDISPSLRWASRFVGGLGIPYGNSKLLPQFKQYFAGGSTGIRAFRARTLGPGAFYADSVTRSIFGNNSFGDIRLELSSELRIKFSSLINGALFVDAGNIWTYGNTEDYGQQAAFSKDFYKQIAVGGGVGLRLDFSFLVFRLDLATPFRKPWYPTLETPKNPWVFNEFNLRDKNWRRENLILNIAVAYPF
ncbi:translocation and assembly module lipoprotein TamL [Arundinibacter roseus]|uniref:Bacterial surface antigen (D15) domain-containing protein n=1 Tax=Arundinibacter roseus TaxID=2070510 RepID=A0A4R4JYU5_9BACT|nr:BamA/TamA family outer membrane protein [Arundinibacter roseus]TDB60044.1 hypothetical protein EZE20_21470 [Arundinibacter roseus]